VSCVGLVRMLQRERVVRNRCPFVDPLLVPIFGPRIQKVLKEVTTGGPERRPNFGPRLANLQLCQVWQEQVVHGAMCLFVGTLMPHEWSLEFSWYVRTFCSGRALIVLSTSDKLMEIMWCMHSRPGRSGIPNPLGACVVLILDETAVLYDMHGSMATSSGPPATAQLSPCYTSVCHIDIFADT